MEERWDWRQHIPPRTFEKVCQSIWDHRQLRSRQLWWNDDLPHGLIVSTIQLHRDFRTTKTVREFGVEKVFFFDWNMLVYVPEPFQVFHNSKYSSTHEAHMAHDEWVQRIRDGGLDFLMTGKDSG